MHPINVRTRFLPFLSCIWSSNNLVIAAVRLFCNWCFFTNHLIIILCVDCRAMTVVQCYITTMTIVAKFGLSIKLTSHKRKKQTDLGELCVLHWFCTNMNLFCCCSAMRKFRDLDKRAIVESTVSNTALDTIHQNTISEIRLFDQKQTKADKITSVGVDGQMVIWDLKVSRSWWSNCWVTHNWSLFFTFRHSNHLWQTCKSSKREPRL